ncbi:MAG TPA: DUF4097 family beta strand repeat-containing protein [Steroidobacteraceae bacterium]|jgi:DUF4097 and DUF4098 domain-containing protein YvlB
MRIRSAAPLLATLLTFAAPAVMAAEKVLDRSFPVTPGGLLTVNADGADVVVAGGDAEQVVVHIAVTGSQKNVDALKLSAQPSADGVKVEALRPSSNWLGMSWSMGNMNARIKVTVPKRYRVELKTSGGNLSVNDLQGDASGKTSGGDVELQNVTGKVQMSTSGGNMKVAHITGDVKLNTSGGDIVASTVQGAIDAETSGGSVHFDSIDGPTRARSSSGDIVANTIHGDTDVDTSGGDVRLLGVDGKIHASTSGGNVHCVLVGANRGISASTSGGNISLQVAKDITATLDASSSGGKVSSELPVSVSTASGKRLSGPINGGGEPIYARTSGGDIEIRVSR